MKLEKLISPISFSFTEPMKYLTCCTVWSIIEENQSIIEENGRTKFISPF